MSEHRHDFQPCLCNDLIVICGGCEHGSFEAFCISRERYSPFNFASASGPAIVVNAGDYLITYCNGLGKLVFSGEDFRELEILGNSEATTDEVIRSKEFALLWNYLLCR